MKAIRVTIEGPATSEEVERIGKALLGAMPQTDRTIVDIQHDNGGVRFVREPRGSMRLTLDSTGGTLDVRGARAL